MLHQAFGWTATSLSLVYKLPQIYVLYTQKKHKGLSIVSLSCQASAYGFYIAHGTLNEDWSIVCMGCASLLQSIVLIVMYFYYKPRSSPSETFPSAQ